MEDRETARMRKYGGSKTTRIMMATVPHVTSGLGLRKFQADGFLLTRVYIYIYIYIYMEQIYLLTDYVTSPVLCTFSSELKFMAVVIKSNITV